MIESALTVRDQHVSFDRAVRSLRVMLAQISPAYDQDVFATEFVARVRDPDRQAERILKIIDHAGSAGVDLLLFPELVAPFSHLAAIEEHLAETAKDVVVCIPYEHTALKDFLTILSREEIEEHAIQRVDASTRLVNFSRIFVKAGSETKVFTQIKLTPFSGEFSLSAKDTLVCGRVLHRFVTNWGTFVFLICKDYVGEVRTERPVPMFDFLKSLTEDGLHYIFVSALNPEPEAFIHAARSFYYLQERSGCTFSVFLNGAELNHTTIVFPLRPHPRARSGEDVELLPLFESKPGWGTQVRFPGRAERLISATLVRLDAYTSMATKEIYSPVHQTELLDLGDLGVASEAIAAAEGAVAHEKRKTGPVPHNLPPQSIPFWGRETELREISKLLADPCCRLLTVIGPGGIGKTRLALQAASEQADAFRDGTYLVSLAPVSSPQFILATAAESLSLSLSSGDDPKVQFLNYLREKQMLLIMDGFEHLLEGSTLVAEILQSAPGVKVLATSRERLNLREEWVLELSGMRVPESADAEDPEQYGALRLFVESARRVRSGFELSADELPFAIRICRLTEGMPLAIELASSWTRTLSCKEILKELEHDLDLLATSAPDVREGHRSLQAVFDHSWALLSGQEQNALMRLSAFRGGFSRGAAEEVAEASIVVLSALVDKSLLRRHSTGRYELSKLVQERAEKKLEEHPQQRDLTRDQHSRYFADFLHERECLLRREDEHGALEEIGQEIENVHRGWAWALERGKREEIGRALDSLYRFYETRSLYREAENAFGAAVNLLKNEAPDVLLGRAMALQGACCRALSMYEKAEELFQRSLSVLRGLGDAEHVAFSLRNLGHISLSRGDSADAEQLFRESLELSSQVASHSETAGALKGLGTVAHRRGHYAEAKDFFEQSLAINRRMGNRKGTAELLNNVAIVADLLGDTGKAKTLFEDSLAIKRKSGDRAGTAITLNNLGIIAMEMGEDQEARRVFAESLAIHKEIGNQVGACNALTNMGYVAARMGSHHEAKRYYREALRISLSVRADPWALMALSGMAQLMADEGQSERALELLALVLHHSASGEETKHEAGQRFEDLKSKLSPGEFSRAQRRGEARELGEVMREILTEEEPLG